MNIINSHKDFVEKEGYKYIGTYEKGDIITTSRGIKKELKFAEYMRVGCPYCKTEYNVRVGEFKKGIRCSHCCRCYEKSFAYYIEKVLNVNIEDYWDFENNIKNPYHLSRACHDKVWIKCDKKKYHGSYPIMCSTFQKGGRCHYCSKVKTNYFDSIGFLYNNVAKMIVKNENQEDITILDTYEISPKSDKKFYFKCNICNTVSSKPKVLKNVMKSSYYCEACSDGMSTAEKFLWSVLSQIGVEFISQVTNNNLKWIEGKVRYDFYIPSINTIVETHGIQHYEDVGFAIKPKEQQRIDNDKRTLALNNNINNYIEIDCRYSDFKYLKNNTINALDKLLDMGNVNFEKAFKDSQSSLVYESWKLFNSGVKSAADISEKLGISRQAVTRYLKRGSDLSICDYDVKKAYLKENRKKWTSHKQAVSIICITTGKIFRSISDGADEYGLKNQSGITHCCKGVYKSSGKLDDGTRLVWRYIKINHNIRLRNNGEKISKMFKK